MDEQTQVTTEPQPTSQTGTAPSWVPIWLAVIVTGLIAGKAAGALPVDFNAEAREYIQYGFGVVTGLFMQAAYSLAKKG